MLRLYGLRYDDPRYAERLESCQDLIWDVALQVLGLGHDVILDWNQWSRERRAKWQRRAEEHGFASQLHFIDVPAEKAIERALHRRDDRSHSIDRAGVEHLVRLLEVPTDDEGITIITVR
jgi:predicted kinase